MPPIVGGFSKIVPAPPGCADDARSRPFTTMDAPGMEHGREGALMRGNTEHTDRHTKEIRYHPRAYEPADGRQAAHGNDGGGPGGPVTGGRGWNAYARFGAGDGRSGFVLRRDVCRRRLRDRPEGGGVPTARDRNRGTPAPVRESLPVRDRVPVRRNGRGRGPFRGPH